MSLAGKSVDGYALPDPDLASSKIMLTGARGRFLFGYIFSFLLVVTLASILGWVLVQREWHRTLGYWETRLSNGAEDRVALISAWVETHCAGAEVVSHYPSLIELLGGKASAPERPMPRAEMLAHLVSLLDLVNRTYDYAGIYAVDPEGRIVAQTTETVDITERGRELARDVCRENKAVAGASLLLSGKTYLAFIAPVHAVDDSTNQPLTNRAIGAVVLMQSLSRLSPFTENEAAPTRTGETLLMRCEGDEVVFMTELRHHDRSKGELRLPVNVPNSVRQAAWKDPHPSSR